MLFLGGSRPRRTGWNSQLCPDSFGIWLWKCLYQPSPHGRFGVSCIFIGSGDCLVPWDAQMSQNSMYCLISDDILGQKINLWLCEDMSWCRNVQHGLWLSVLFAWMSEWPLALLWGRCRPVLWVRLCSQSMGWCRAGFCFSHWAILWWWCPAMSCVSVLSAAVAYLISLSRWGLNGDRTSELTFSNSDVWWLCGGWSSWEGIGDRNLDTWPVADGVVVGLCSKKHGLKALGGFWQGFPYDGD